MSQITRIDSKTIPWDANLRFRVNESCEHNLLTWFNLTGANGEPGVSSDWDNGVNHANGSSLNNIPKTDANGNHVDSVLYEDNNSIAIGKTTADERLDVHDGNIIFTHPDNQSIGGGITDLNGIIWKADDDSAGRSQEEVAAIRFLPTGNWSPTYSPHVLSFETLGIVGAGTIQRMVINQLGNVGIDSITPGNKLEVIESSDTQWAIVAVNNTAAGKGVLVSAGANGSVTPILRLASNTSNTKFEVTNEGKVFVSGVLTHGSDKRIKEEISNCKYGLKEILRLDSVKYDFISGLKNQFGLIAQDVIKIIPECVDGVEGDLKKGEILTINYISLIPILINSVKELNEENQDLKQQLNKQNKEIKEIKKHLGL